MEVKLLKNIIFILERKKEIRSLISINDKKIKGLIIER